MNLSKFVYILPSKEGYLISIVGPRGGVFKFRLDRRQARALKNALVHELKQKEGNHEDNQ